MPFLSESRRSDLERLSKEQRAVVLRRLQMVAPRDCELVKAEADQRQAVLTLTGLVPHMRTLEPVPSRGTVWLVRDGRGWRLEREHWQADAR